MILSSPGVSLAVIDARRFGSGALVVRINGAVERPDRGAYHITWSLDRARGRRPVESNDVIAHAWKPFDRAERVELHPAIFD